MNIEEVSIDTHKYYLDVVKIIAILLVIFNHTGSRGYVLFTEYHDVSQWKYYFYMLFGIFAKMGVPLFIMCSGVVLLGKKENIKSVIKNRFFKYLIALIIFSAINYMYQFYCMHTIDRLSIKDFMITIYTSKMATAYWYLYAYLAYILVIPFLRLLNENMKQNHYEYLILLVFALRIWGSIQLLLWGGNIVLNSSFSFYITSDFFFFPLVGYYLDQYKLGKKRSSIKIRMLIVSLLAVALSCISVNRWCEVLGEWKEGTCQNFLNSFPFIFAICLFWYIKDIFDRNNCPIKVKKSIRLLGEGTFGVFLFEGICRNITDFVYTELYNNIGSMTASILWVLAAFTLGEIITYIIKKVPIINRFI